MKHKSHACSGGSNSSPMKSSKGALYLTLGEPQGIFPPQIRALRGSLSHRVAALDPNLFTGYPNENVLRCRHRYCRIYRVLADQQEEQVRIRPDSDPLDVSDSCSLVLVLHTYSRKMFTDFPFLLGIEQPLPLFHGVFLYFYVGSLTRQLPEKEKFLVLHFVPATVIYLYLVTFFILPADQKIQVYRNHGAGYELFNMLRSYAIALSGIFYVIWSAVLLRKHRNNIRDQFSDLEKVNLQWLQILTFGLGGIWFLVIFFRSEILIFGGSCCIRIPDRLFRGSTGGYFHAKPVTRRMTMNKRRSIRNPD